MLSVRRVFPYLVAGATGNVYAVSSTFFPNPYPGIVSGIYILQPISHNHDNRGSGDSE
jgi:hypothetical protein